MADSQPGKVGTFDPSVTLTNFSADTRDRFVYNENQLVLAKLQRAQPVSTTARTRTASEVFIEYAEYVNSEGELAYIDGSFQALDTPGKPTTPIHQIVIGFAQQVTTPEVKFWSTSFVDTSEVYIQYSFDNTTWFDVGAVTWVQIFDDTIENFPGDAPPTGQYQYTGTFDSGNVTARYWRVRGDVDAVYSGQSGSNPNKIFNVDSTANFPDAGSLSAVVGDASRTMSYTGKTATSFTGVNDPNSSPVTEKIDFTGDYLASPNGSITLVLDSTTGFPTESAVKIRFFYTSAGTSMWVSYDLTYTGISGRALTGVTIYPDPDEIRGFYNGFWTDFWTIRDILLGNSNLFIYDGVNAPEVDYTPLSLFSGLKVYVANSWGSGVTELQIVSTTDPILQHWNSDGSQAVSVSLDGSDFYDVAYDKSDDVYYAISFSAAIAGAAITTPDDDFSTGDGTGFSTSKWVESTTNSYFQRSTLSGTLDMRSPGGDGQLTSTYGVDGNFSASIDLVSMIELQSPKGYFSLEALDYSLGNVQLMSGIAPVLGVDITTSGVFFAATMTYTDTVGGVATLNNFRIDPSEIDFNYPGGVIDYNFVYSESTGAYTVTVSGISHPAAVPGPLYQLDSAEFSISNFSAPADGEGFAVAVVVSKTTPEPTAVSGTRLQIERAGTNGYSRYEIPTNPAVWVDSSIGNVPADRFKIQLFGSPFNSNVNIGLDDFALIPSGDLFFDSPVLTVTTLDKSGNKVQVASVSDADGYAIKSLDLIQDTAATYNNYLSPRVGIATNGLGVGSGGEIYIKVNGTLYRYLKSVLPLTSPEDGTAAATTTTGEIPETGITGFTYNGYSQAGLCYIEYNQPLSGVFVRAITASSLLAQPEKILLDITNINYPFAWNVTDLSTLYYVDGTALKLYDLNETKAAFANVSSDKQVLAAGTQETAVITAQVLNVYGETKSNKSMTFSVSAGDGAVSPAIGCSNGTGEGTTTYTVGSAVGPATVTVTVSDVTC